MTDSHALLVEYAEHGTESAFRELVDRYIDLVYSTALRQVGGDAHLAKDVAQTVFLHLSKKARQIPQNVMLGGWLHQAAINVATTVVRAERRRQMRERQAVEMNTLQNDPAGDLDHVGPLLDEAISQLAEEDRTAVLLRFFEKRDLRSVGEALGSSEDAARMRVSRALEKLELLLKRRGITSSAAALSVVLSANAIQAAPAGLAAAITAATLAGGTISTATVVAATKTITMTTLQKTLLIATVATLAGVGIYEVRQSAQLHERLQALQQRQAEEIQQVQSERDDATNRLASALNEVEKMTKTSSELLQLRNEVNRLRKQAETLAAAAEEAEHYRSKLMQILSNPPPVKTFYSTALITTTWKQPFVTGGWRTPSGKRAIVMARAFPEDNNPQALTVKSYVLEYTESAASATGLDRFNRDEQNVSKATELSDDQFEAIQKAANNHDGVELVHENGITTVSGNLCEFTTVDTCMALSGEKYVTGPVIDIIPTIASDGQSVEMMISAHLNYAVQQLQPR